MIDLIIFSKDRAAQLESLLYSKTVFAPSIFDCHILCHYEDKTSLNIVKNEYKATFEDQTGPFLGHLNHLVNSTNSDYVCFAADDNVIFDTIPSIDMRNTQCFSLRLGFNTVVQDHFKKTKQPLLNSFVDEDQTISWNKFNYHPLTNYGYFWALDCHIYSKDLFMKLFPHLRCDTPNQLESSMVHNQSKVYTSIMRSFKHSKTVNVPLNNFSGITQSLNQNIDDMCQRFISGERMRFDIDPKDIVGCHQNITPRWEKI